LWTIANSNGVSVGAIEQLNGLTTDFLSIGQVLQLSSYVAPAAPAPVVAAAPAAGASTYIVCSGDILGSIAQRYGTTVEAIKAANGLSSDMLQIGQNLIINGSGAAPAVSPTVSRSGDSVTGAEVVAKASQYLGTPYRYGGTTPAGFDCSGFTQYIFAQFRISLNRTAAAQYSNGYAVSKSELQAGDLVFFACGGYGISHVGIYCGNGNFIHSSTYSTGVIKSSLSEAYYASRYVGGRRVTR
jgi:peptidoglycan endopeptidase LytE